MLLMREHRERNSLILECVNNYTPSNARTYASTNLLDLVVQHTTNDSARYRHEPIHPYAYALVFARPHRTDPFLTRDCAGPSFTRSLRVVGPGVQDGPGAGLIFIADACPIMHKHTRIRMTRRPLRTPRLPHLASQLRSARRRKRFQKRSIGTIHFSMDA